jgi:hypothetical protein
MIMVRLRLSDRDQTRSNPDFGDCEVRADPKLRPTTRGLPKPQKIDQSRAE